MVIRLMFHFIQPKQNGFINYPTQEEMRSSAESVNALTMFDGVTCYFCKIELRPIKKKKSTALNLLFLRFKTVYIIHQKNSLPRVFHLKCLFNNGKKCLLN